MKPFNRIAGWALAALVSAIALGCGGGGGGGGDGGDDGGGGGGDGEVVLLPRYQFQLTSAATNPLTVVAPFFDADGMTLVMRHLGEGPGIFGAFEVAAGALTIAEGSNLAVEEVGNPLDKVFQDFTVQVTGTWRLPADGPPDQGSLVAARLIMAGHEHVYADVTANGDLQLRWDQTGDGTIEAVAVYSFEMLDGVMDANVPEWHKFGVFAVEIVAGFVPELVGFGTMGLELIVDELADLSPLVISCDAFSSLGRVVPMSPPGIPDQGLLTFTWLDDNANREVGPGDSFELDANYCLMDDPLDDIDDMLNGKLGFYSYTEVTRNSTLVRVGFEGISPAQNPGGVAFDDLQLWEVWDSDGQGPGNASTAEIGAMINGRYSLVFFEPTS